jgi:hypothetical protein
MNDALLISINFPTLFIFIITLLAIGVCFFLAGYLLGSQNHNGVYSIGKKSLIQPQLKTNIPIDETKIVTKIITDDLEKKYNQLGETKNSQESISSSVNKLKALKGE